LDRTVELSVLPGIRLGESAADAENRSVPKA
jgi:hypothetical protein